MSDDPVLGILTEILSRLGRVEGEVASVKSEIADVKSTGLATHAQTVRTNGRVTVLEKAKAYADGVRAATTWVPKLAFALVVAVVGGGAGAAIAALIG